MAGLLGLTLMLNCASPALADDDGHDNRAFLPNPVTMVSTVPANGDVNPYGVAFVPKAFPAGGTISPGDILVSNFNNAQNLQGTGTTIVKVPATGKPTVFFQGQPGLGLTTALAALRAGVVIVGNLPTADGTCATAKPGSLLILNGSGATVTSLASATLLNGPWDLTVDDDGNQAQVFVSNVLSGTITRLDLRFAPTGVTVASMVQIASGYLHRCDPAALVVGPTGLVYDAEKDTLYVASTADNAVFVVSQAGRVTGDHGTGAMIYQDPQHLHGPLAMAMAPNGHLIVSNADVINSDPNQPSELVEFTKNGKFVKQLSVDPAQGGSFGLAVGAGAQPVRLAAVDDNTASLTIWTIPVE